jgi:hypothetical protein
VTGSEPHTTDKDPASALVGSYLEMARTLFSAGSPTITLQSVVNLAVETIEGCDYAGIFVLDGNALRTSVHTDPIVIDLDDAQRRWGEGPCLDAIAQGGAVYADDLARNAQWPRFGAQATAAGICSALGLGLGATGTRGALNLYARYPRAFGVIDRARGLILAALADLALFSAEAQADRERQADNLRSALLTRELIGQAKGILMERERVTADQAFDILRQASQHLNVKLHEIAQRLVDTGERPDTGPFRIPP